MLLPWLVVVGILCGVAVDASLVSVDGADVQVDAPEAANPDLESVQPLDANAVGVYITGDTEPWRIYPIRPDDTLETLTARITQDLEAQMFADVNFFNHKCEPVSDIRELLQSDFRRLYITHEKKMYCYWPVDIHNNPLVTPDGRHLEMVNIARQPRIFSIENFLSEDECDYIIQKATAQGLEGSPLYKIGEDGVGSIRTDNEDRNSQQTWLSDDLYDPVLKVISERVQFVSKLPLEYAEQTQVVHYYPGQHYWAHTDYFYLGATDNEDEIRAGVNRVVTVLYYLNEVEAGGDTCFPRAHNAPFNYDYTKCQGLRVKPKKGLAILFYNLHPDMTPDELSLHMGSDVEKGEKWIANKWMRNFSIY